MASPTTVERRRIHAAGADELLDAFDPAAGGVGAARALAAASVDWPSIRAEVVASERSVILAERPGGPVLAAKWFAPHEATTIHDHGHAGAALVVEGSSRYERFVRVGEATARLASTHEAGVGEVAWWNEPPDDVHRQTAGEAGALELVFLAGEPTDVATFDEVR